MRRMLRSQLLNVQRRQDLLVYRVVRSVWVGVNKRAVEAWEAAVFSPMKPNAI